ncbi:TNT domain-containing protein [Actinosynnema sp. NPDC004786]
MGIELPAELADVAAKAGVSWPQADEDALRASAAAWREAGAKLSTLAGESDGSAGKALAALSGPTGEAARGHWNTFTAPDGTVNTVLRGCAAAADRLDHAAEQIGAAKVELVRELVNLAKNTDAAQQAANAGHPTALLGLETAVRGAAANVAHLTDTLTSAVRLDSGVQIGGHRPPVDVNPGVHAPGDAGPGAGPSEGGRGPHGGGPAGGLPGGGSSGGGLGLGLLDGLLPGGSEGSGGSGGGAGSAAPAAAAPAAAAPGAAAPGAAPGHGQAPGLIGGLVGAVTDTVNVVAQPVVETVDVVGDAVDRTVQGAADGVQGVTETVAPGRDHGPDHAPGHGPGPDHVPPGRGGTPPGPGTVVGDLVNPVLGAVPAAAGPVVDAVTRTEGTVNQSSAAVLDRPLLPHAEAPHAPAQPAAPAANPAAPQGPSFSGPSLGGGPTGAPAAAAAAAAVTPAPAATTAPNAPATTQAPGQQPGQQTAPKAEAKAAQAPQPGQTPAGQPGSGQPGSAQSGSSQSGQAQPGASQSGSAQSGQGQSGQNQSAQGPGKAEAAAKADGQAKPEGQAKGEGAAKPDAQAKGEAAKGEGAAAQSRDDADPRDLRDTLAALGRQVVDGDLAFAILPLPTGGRAATGPLAAGPLPAGPLSGVLPTEADDTPPPVRAARTAQPTTAAAAAFLLHMFPGGMLPPPGATPARQLPPPSEDEAFAAGLRFPPQGHPDGHLVDTSAQLGLDLRAGGRDGLRSRLSGAEPTASADPVPAVNRPRLALGPGGAPDPALLEGHDPLAGMHERDWDRRFLVRADPPEYAWPPGELFPEGGYEEGRPGVLAVGVELDRFGGPEGRVLSQLGTPFAERSLPPALVGAGYHRYRVVRVLPVWFTLSAEWFGQPGGGVRYRATHPVADLVALGYLEEMA